MLRFPTVSDDSMLRENISSFELTYDDHMELDSIQN